MDVIVFDTHSDVYSVINQSTSSSRSKRKEMLSQYYTFIHSVDFAFAFEFEIETKLTTIHSFIHSIYT